MRLPRSLGFSSGSLFICSRILFAHSEGHGQAGLVAAIVGALLPLPGRLFKWEAVFTGWALASSAWMMTRILKGDTRIWTLVGFGALLGAGILLSLVFILAWPNRGLLLLSRQSVKPLAIALLIALTLAGLGTVRNFMVFRHFVFIRDDAGMALVSSNNDCATALISKNIASGCFAHEHLAAAFAMLEKMMAAGEYEFSAAEVRRTRDWVRLHVSRFAILTLQRAGYFWFPLDRLDRASRLRGIMMSTVTVLSNPRDIAGQIRRPPYSYRCVAAVLAYYYIDQFERRYRYRVLWISLLFASIGMELLINGDDSITAHRSPIAHNTGMPAGSR